MSDTPPEENKTADWLTHQWVVAGIVSASSRFIPIPFVDDVVRNQCRRFVVSRTLSSHRTDIPLDTLKPYYSTGGGCIGGCAGLIVKVPLKLLLFPIRKIVSMVTSVHGVPLEVMRTVLLGRTLDRYLQNGKLENDPAQAAKMRIAFEESFARMDFHVLRAAMTDALKSASGWKSAAIESAKQIAGPRDAEAEGLEVPTDVESGANKIQAVLDRPETATLFAEFDQRFDARMQE